jgi:hypothetical protein
LQSKLIEIVRDCQVKAFRSYQSLNISTLENTNSLTQGTEARARLPILGIFEGPDYTESDLAAYAPVETLADAPFGHSDMDTFYAGFQLPLKNPHTSDSGYGSQLWTTGVDNGFFDMLKDDP